MSKAQPITDGMNTVTPHLVCKDAARAIEFYKKAFGAEERFRLNTPDGKKVLNASIVIGDSMVMLADEFPDWGSVGPETLKGTPVVLHLNVKDADSAFDQAVRAGATVTMPLEEMFWGDRYGQVRDPFGHSWSIATHIRDVSLEEMEQAAKAMFGQQP
jgi:PhnB protein